MKKQVFSFAVFFFLIAFCLSLNGQVSGDYRSYQSGNWNDAGNWEKYNGTNWYYPASEFPPLVSPWISKRVTIQNGHTITATSILTGAPGGILEIAEGGTLQMGNYYIRGSGTIGVSAKFPSIIINGHFTTNSYINSQSFHLGSTGRFVTSYSGTQGWWSTTVAPGSVVLDGEIEFNGSGTQIVPVVPANYANLIVSGLGEKMVSGEIIVSGIFNINPNTTVNIEDCLLYIYGGGAGIVNEGTINFSFAYLVFEDGAQTFSGSGSFNGPIDYLSVGEMASSNVVYTVPQELTVIDMIINSGSSLTLGPTTKVTVNNSLTTNNALTLRASSSEPYTCASLIIGHGATIDGNANIELFLTGGGDEDLDDYKWHYISSPVASLSTDVFTGGGDITENLAQYIESRPSTSLLQGWVAFDGFSYSPRGQMTGITFNSLDVGKGYNYYDDIAHTFVISGVPNKSDVIANLSYTSIPQRHGFNLLGNPFTAGLNWDDITDGIYFAYPANTSKGLYFTRSNQQCTYIRGVGIPGDVNGIIPPMQGFFTKTYSAGNSIILPVRALTHNNIHQRYKGDPSAIPLVRLAVSESTEANDETVVRFDESAKPDFDYDFDAAKMLFSETATAIYTALSGTNFAINGLPFPEDGSVVEIPVIVNLATPGAHKISAIQIQGLDSYNVSLRDNVTDITTNLKTTPDVSFVVPAAGSVSGRFVLKVGNSATAIENPLADPKDFSVYQAYGKINIMTLDDKWNGLKGSVTMFDMTGRKVSGYPDAEFNRSSLIRIDEPRAKGLYIVEIRSGMKRYVAKVLVK